MRPLMSLIAIALCVEILQVRWSFGQALVCDFVLEDGTSIGSSVFGYALPATKDIETTGKELLVAKAINVKDIKGVTSSSLHKPLYISATFNDTHLLLKLTEEFAHYEEYESSRSTSFYVEFACAETTRKIEFILPITDTNNHDPEFVDAPYVYELPMPFPNDLPLTSIAPISARDIDLTNTNISFSLDGDYNNFFVSWLSMDWTDRKRHNAKLVPTAIISLVDDVTFNLTATDTGTPQRQTTTTVTIKVDQKNSILRFARPLYTANLTELTPETADGMVITFAEGEVSLGSGADKTVNYIVQDEFSGYSKNFEAITADDHAKVKIRLVDLPASFFDESFILLKLTASNPKATETTILHIWLPGRPIENSNLRFTRSLYTANLTELTPETADGKVITFAEGEVSLGSGADNTVIYTVQDEFSGYSKNFEAITADDHAKVKIRLVDLPASFFDESFILLKLTASNSKATETTILHIWLPGRPVENSNLRFTRSLYTANLTELTPETADGMVITFAEGEVSLGSGADNTVIYTVQDEFSGYSKNFEAITADDHAKVKIRLVDLPASFFDESFILLKLTASNPKATETTILHIWLPGRPIENSNLRFTRSLYTANLTELTPEAADGMVITFAEGEVSLGSGADKTVNYIVQDAFSGYSKNFEAITADDHAKVKIRLVDLPASFFDESFILLKLTASKPEATETTILHILLPGRPVENSNLRFTRSLYTANLTELTPETADGMVITFAEGEVSLGSGADKTVNYIVQDAFSGYSKNFEAITADDHAKVKIRLVDLPASFFDESFILLKLTASKPGALETTILHISLPGSGEGLPETEVPKESEDSPVAIIVLSGLLAVVGVGLVVSVVVKCRHCSK